MSLCALISRPEDVLSRDEIAKEVWGDDRADERLTRAISLLRKEFGDRAKPPRIIETVAKHGYRLACRLASSSRHNNLDGI